MSDEKKKIAELEKENEALKKDSEAQDQVIKELQAENEEVSTAAAEKEVITIGKEKYQVTLSKFRVKGNSDKIYTLEDLKADPELQKKLVDTKSGVLKKV